MRLNKATVKKAKRIMAALKRRGDPASLRSAEQLVTTLRRAAGRPDRRTNGNGRRAAGVTVLANNSEAMAMFKEAGSDALKAIRGQLTPIIGRSLVPFTRGMRKAMRQEYGARGERELEQVMGGFIDAVIADVFDQAEGLGSPDNISTIADEVKDLVAQEEMKEDEEMDIEENDDLGDLGLEDGEEPDLDDAEEGQADPWREPAMGAEDEPGDDEELDLDVDEEEDVTEARVKNQLQSIAYRVRMAGNNDIADAIVGLLS
jgi:hypothetical protein